MQDLVPKTIAQLEREGFRAGRVECRNQYIARDLFKFADVAGWRCGGASLESALVQVTSASNVAARKAKVEQHCQMLLHPDLYLEVWGWHDGELKRRERWTGREWVEIT